MKTPLQKAAQAAIDHADEFYALYKRTVKSGCLPFDELKFVAAQKELRKALDAELAQSVEPERCGYDETTGNCTKNPCCNLSANQAEPVEPFAYFNIGTEYHVKGKIIFHKGLTPNLEDRWWGPDTPLYLHPPQPQATTPVSASNWLIRKEPNTKDKYYVAEGNPPANVLEIYGITQGEKP